MEIEGLLCSAGLLPRLNFGHHEQLHELIEYSLAKFGAVSIVALQFEAFPVTRDTAGQRLEAIATVGQTHTTKPTVYAFIVPCPLCIACPLWWHLVYKPDLK